MTVDHVRRLHWSPERKWKLGPLTRSQIYLPGGCGVDLRWPLPGSRPRERAAKIPQIEPRARPSTHPWLRPRGRSVRSFPHRPAQSRALTFSSHPRRLTWKWCQMGWHALWCVCVCVSACSRAGLSPCVHVCGRCVCVLLYMPLIKRRSGLSDHASGSPCSMNAKHNWACPEQPSMAAIGGEQQQTHLELHHCQCVSSVSPPPPRSVCIMCLMFTQEEFFNDFFFYTFLVILSHNNRFKFILLLWTEPFKVICVA